MLSLGESESKPSDPGSEKQPMCFTVFVKEISHNRDLLVGVFSGLEYPEREHIHKSDNKIATTDDTCDMKKSFCWEGESGSIPSAPSDKPRKDRKYRTCSFSRKQELKE